MQGKFGLIRGWKGPAAKLKPALRSPRRPVEKQSLLRVVRVGSLPLGHHQYGAAHVVHDALIHGVEELLLEKAHALVP